MSFWREYGQKELDKCQHKIGNFAELIIIYKSIHLVPFIDRERERERRNILPAYSPHRRTHHFTIFINYKTMTRCLFPISVRQRVGVSRRVVSSSTFPSIGVVTLYGTIAWCHSMLIII